MPDFRERKIDSVWIDDFTAFSKRQWDDFSYKYTDAETLKEVQDRNISALNSVMEKYENKNIVVGSHGTSLSLIINYYDKTFNYSNFEKIKDLMPWVVRFTFQGKECIDIQDTNLFTK